MHKYLHTTWFNRYQALFLLLDNSSFHARAISTLSKPSSSLHGFRFQSVVNNGNVYDSYNGTFTCPASGLYAFVCTVESRDGKSFGIYFYRGGSKLNSIPIQPDASSGDYVDTSSTLQIFSLSRGDNIYLYSTDSNSAIQGVHSTFSGWRISSSKYQNLSNIRFQIN